MDNMKDLEKWVMTQDITQAELHQAIENLRNDTRINEDKR